MNYLLDTQCFLWSYAAPELLSDPALDILTDGKSLLFFSAASSWEIAIKVGIGKLQLPEPPEIYVPKRLISAGIQELAIEHKHVLQVHQLPPLHKDPFDRVLIAQAIVESLTLLTADSIIAQYGVPTVWAAK